MPVRDERWEKVSWGTDLTFARNDELLPGWAEDEPLIRLILEVKIHERVYYATQRLPERKWLELEDEIKKTFWQEMVGTLDFHLWEGGERGLEVKYELLEPGLTEDYLWTSNVYHFCDKHQRVEMIHATELELYTYLNDYRHDWMNMFIIDE